MNDFENRLLNTVQLILIWEKAALQRAAFLLHLSRDNSFTVVSEFPFYFYKNLQYENFIIYLRT
jgi:hypothetical protein